jgi:hypothetical protein
MHFTSSTFIGIVKRRSMKSYACEGMNGLPTIILSKSEGVFKVKGVSTPDNAKEFFEPALTWMDEYVKSPNHQTEFVFELEYFNISSSKIILFILYKLLDIQNAGHQVKVTWCYNDAYLLGAGRDYAYMVKVPFEFKKVARRESTRDIAA